MYKEINLIRDVEAIQIPSGDAIQISEGTKVVITQSLGGTYTIATDSGLARINAENFDALGIDEEGKSENLKKSQELFNKGDIKNAIWDQLKLVFDPEIPVNIVDLGLVYDCVIKNNDLNNIEVNVKMTLTAPGCGMGPTIAADAKSKILQLEGIKDATVDLVWDPVWNQDMISEEGKMKLGIL